MASKIKGVGGRSRSASYDDGDDTERLAQERRGKRSVSEGAEQTGSVIEGRAIRVGICAMDGKARATAMNEIIGRMVTFAGDGTLDIVYFGNECILNEPVEEWPVVDALLSWFSKGFPLEKAEAYAVLRNPLVVNDLPSQRILWDRRKVNAMLKAINVPTVRSVVVDREDPTNLPVFEEFLDYIMVDGFKMEKPFVEKPVSGEDHNIYIYYSSSSGGGSKRLFRKIKNVSSQFYPDDSCVRRGESFIYESFVPTSGTDIKVYTVGPRYAHAEARKSPVVDGVVKRGANGKEERFPILLKPFEKDIARKICTAFKQTVCGFDMLRSPSGTFVCDVNGWSFVKTSPKYWDDCAHILVELILRQLAPDATVDTFVQRSIEIRGRRKKKRTPVRSTSGGTSSRPGSPEQSGLLIGGSSLDDGAARSVSSERSSPVPRRVTQSPPSPGTVDDRTANVAGPSKNEKLRCVIGIFRHGDRTPKEKLKIKVQWPAYLELFDRFAYTSSGGRHSAAAPLFSGTGPSPAVVQRQSSLVSSIRRDVSMTSLDGNGSPSAESNFKSASSTSGGLSEGEEVNRPRELKLKKPRELQAVLDATNLLLGPLGPYADRIVANNDDSGDDDTDDQYRQLLQVRSVLEKYGNFRGINRKVQIKPVAFHPVTGKVTKATFILKWGGVLTRLGRLQAEKLGTRFRHEMYRSGHGQILDVLRLHATHRHDLKIYASDEGRVLMTAAAFAKSFLDLEGGLTPVVTTLINKAPRMLNEIDSSSRKIMKKVKENIGATLSNPAVTTTEDALRVICPTGARGESVISAVNALHAEHSGVLRGAMRDLYDKMSVLKTHLAAQLATAQSELDVMTMTRAPPSLDAGYALTRTASNTSVASLVSIQSDNETDESEAAGGTVSKHERTSSSISTGASADPHNAFAVPQPERLTVPLSANASDLPSPTMGGSRYVPILFFRHLSFLKT